MVSDPHGTPKMPILQIPFTDAFASFTLTTSDDSLIGLVQVTFYSKAPLTKVAKPHATATFPYSYGLIAAKEPVASDSPNPPV